MSPEPVGAWALVPVVLLVGVPLAGALSSLTAGRRSAAPVRVVALGGSLLTLVLAVVVAAPRLGDAPAVTGTLAETTAVVPPLGLTVLVDPLSAVLVLLVAGVAGLVQVYSTEYLRGDPRYPSYAALVWLFTAAMLTVVVADDLWVLLVGWEVMGACSYFLISHHWELEPARAGAVKAFLMTRGADLGLLLAVIVLGERFESYRISEVLADVAARPPARDELWLPALLVVVAVLGKSAQAPFHTWLPDAMPGPTPVSALIHAATMVAAGVFLVARLHPLLLTAPAAMNLLALAAAVTMLVGSVAALRADDLKRVLAWSTVSQLALMLGALAVGAWAAAVLHLLVHGAFKALLFLGAGSVMHAVGSSALRATGGLRSALPTTFATMTVGFGALAGVVPLAGFFTKDALLGGALEEAREGRLVWPWLAWLVVGATAVTAVLTMAYCVRAWWVVFLGPAPAPTEAADPAPHPHEPGWSMRAPLVVLAVPAALGGLLVLYPTVVLGGSATGPLVHPAEAAASAAVLLLVGALTLAWVRRVRPAAGAGGPRAARVVAVLPRPSTDRAYDAALVRPVRRLAHLVRAGESQVVVGWADGAAASARGLGWALRLSQTGRVQAYLVVLVVGVVAAAVGAGVLA